LAIFAMNGDNIACATEKTTTATTATTATTNPYTDTDTFLMNRPPN
jgi:hypothetical protein